MLRVVLLDVNDVAQAVAFGSDRIRKAFSTSQQLNSISFGATTHEVSFVACHLAVRLYQKQGNKPTTRNDIIGADLE